MCEGLIVVCSGKFKSRPQSWATTPRVRQQMGALDRATALWLLIRFLSASRHLRMTHQGLRPWLRPRRSPSVACVVPSPGSRY